MRNQQGFLNGNGNGHGSKLGLESQSVDAMYMVNFWQLIAQFSATATKILPQLTHVCFERQFDVGVRAPSPFTAVELH